MAFFNLSLNSTVSAAESAASESMGDSQAVAKKMLDLGLTANRAKYDSTTKLLGSADVLQEMSEDFRGDIDAVLKALMTPMETKSGSQK